MKIIGIEEHKGSFFPDYKKEMVEYNDILVKVKVLWKFSSNDEHGIVFVTYYNSEGKELGSAKAEVCDEIKYRSREVSYTGSIIYKHETLYPGEIRHYTLPRGKDTHVSYKIWLYKGR